MLRPLHEDVRCIDVETFDAPVVITRRYLKVCMCRNHQCLSSLSTLISKALPLKTMNLKRLDWSLVGDKKCSLAKIVLGCFHRAVTAYGRIEKYRREMLLHIPDIFVRL